jgi:WD40 repeat protein
MIKLPTLTTPAPAVKIEPAQTHLVQELKHNSPLIGCRFDPSGRFVFAGAQDNSVLRWELASGKKTPFVSHNSWVRALAFQPRDKVLFSGGYEGRILAWSVEGDSPVPRWSIDAHKGWVRALAVNPDGRLLASCGNDNLVRLWSTTDGRPKGELAGHPCHVYNVAFHPEGKHLVSADLKGVVKVWDLATATLAREFDAGILHKYDNTFLADIGGIRGMAFSPDGALLACAGITEVTNAFAGVGKPLVVLFDWKAGKPKQLLRPKENFQGTAWGVGFHSTGHVVGVGGGNGGTLWFWKPDQTPDVFALKLPTNARDLDLHPDGRRLAIAFFDGAVRVYDVGPRSQSG